VLELLEEKGMQDKVKVIRMGIPDRIVTHGDAKLLLAKYGLDADGNYMRIKEKAVAGAGNKKAQNNLKIIK